MYHMKYELSFLSSISSHWYYIPLLVYNIHEYPKEKKLLKLNFKNMGVFTCSILASIVTILVKYCDITHKYWANTWKMCSPASAILASIVTILVSFEAILIYFKGSGRTKTLTFYKYWVNTHKYHHNTQQVLSQYLQVLIRWIHPWK